MEKTDRSSERDLTAWLEYYRDLGFTHLYRREPSVLEAASAGADLRPPEAAIAAGKERGVHRPAESFPTAGSQPAVSTAAEQNGLFTPAPKQETLEQIRADLGDCQRCKLSHGRRNIVFGSGNPKAELVFVGEGPGADEDEQGLPFVGRAGQLLTDMIEKGLKIPRPDVYICNIVKCRPPGNRKPERDEVAACREFVERQIDSIRPRVICLLGATAAETVLDSRESMGRLRGRWFEFHGFPVMVTFHPAFLLRDPSRKADTWADLKLILARLNASPSA